MCSPKQYMKKRLLNRCSLTRSSRPSQLLACGPLHFSMAHKTACKSGWYVCDMINLRNIWAFWCVPICFDSLSSLPMAGLHMRTYAHKHCHKTWLSLPHSSHLQKWPAVKVQRIESGVYPVSVFHICTTQWKVLCTDAFTTVTNPLYYSGERWSSWLQQSQEVMYKLCRDHVIMFTAP